jgi:hypothetical protein
MLKYIKGLDNIKTIPTFANVLIQTQYTKRVVSYTEKVIYIYLLVVAYIYKV